MLKFRKYGLSGIILKVLDDGMYVIKISNIDKTYLVPQKWIDDFYDKDLSKFQEYIIKKDKSININPNIKEKIDFLDSFLSKKFVYNEIDIPAFSGDKVIIVNKIAKVISKHLGLGNYIFNVGFVSQNKGHAGHIEIQNFDTFVNIEISSEIENFNSIVAILCHEIMHKFLYVNNIKKAILYENEILTDIATIYMGLGKILLNGYNYTYQYEEDSKRIAVEHNIGYLSEYNLFETYMYIVYLNDINPEKAIKNIFYNKLPILEKVCQNHKVDLSSYLDVINKRQRKNTFQNVEEQISTNAKAETNNNKNNSPINRVFVYIKKFVKTRLRRLRSSD